MLPVALVWMERINGATIRGHYQPAFTVPNAFGESVRGGYLFYTNPANNCVYSDKQRAADNWNYRPQLSRS